MVELTLKWEKFGLSKGLHEMLGVQELVDVSIACQGEHIQAHKAVLAACSKHFRQIFIHNPCKHPIVVLQGIQLKHFKSILNFVYLGEVTVLEDELTDFLATADLLGVSALSSGSSKSQKPLPDYLDTETLHFNDRTSSSTSPGPQPDNTHHSRSKSSKPFGCLPNKPVQPREVSPQDTIHAHSVDTLQFEEIHCDKIKNEPEEQEDVEDIVEMQDEEDEEHDINWVDPLEGTSSEFGHPNMTVDMAQQSSHSRNFTRSTISGSTMPMHDQSGPSIAQMYRLSQKDQTSPETIVPPKRLKLARKGKGYCHETTDPVEYEGDKSIKLADKVEDCHNFQQQSTMQDDPDIGSDDTDSDASRDSMSLIPDAELDEASSEGAQSSKRTNAETKKLALQNLLWSSDEGLSVLSSYNKNGYLRDAEQNSLSALVISHLFSKTEDKKIRKETFVWWSSAVCTLFPNECEEVYYVPFIQGPTGTVRAHGKFVSRYSNMRGKFFNTGLLQRPKRGMKRSLDVPPPFIITEEIVRAMNWLRKSCDPWELVHLHWSKSSEARFQELKRILSQGKSLQDYVSLYKALELERGYELILLDYQNLPRNVRSDICFFATFADVRSAVIKIASERQGTEQLITDYASADELNDETRDLCCLLLLPDLITAPTRSYKDLSGEKKTWKPSIADARESFILHIRSVDELALVERKREQAARSRNIYTEPVIIVVARDVQKVEAVYIRIASLTYKVQSLCKAIDVLFKAFQVLQIRYPIPCEHIWMAIQHGLYKLRLPKDSMFTAVQNFIGRLQKAT